MPYIFITGASSGLGEATAKLLSQQYDCILLGRNQERLAAVSAECAQHGHTILQFPYDLVNVEPLAATLSAFLKEHDAQVEGFVHFAGMTEVLPMSKTKYSVGLQVMNVNYFSACEIISTLLKRRVNADCLNKIVLISSIAALVGAPHQPHYCASKGAIRTLTLALARDLAPKVRVNAVTPGSFQTRIWNTPLQNLTETPDWSPPSLLPPGKPFHVAHVVDFLLSEKAAYLTGVNITVDGGEHFNFGK